MTGIILMAPYTTAMHPLDNIGRACTSGSVLFSLGSLNGFLIRFRVDEKDAHKISLKQAVHVKGIAFPELLLDGFIQRIGSQVIQDRDRSYFIATAIIPKISEVDLKKIKIGMRVSILANYLKKTCF